MSWKIGVAAYKVGISKTHIHVPVEKEPEIFTSNSRNMLAHMNQMRYSIEYSIAKATVFDETNLSDIEDALNGMILSSQGSKDYKMLKEIIQNLADEM